MTTSIYKIRVGDGEVVTMSGNPEKMDKITHQMQRADFEKWREYSAESPSESAYYLVWCPLNEELGSEEYMDMCYWSEETGRWSEGQFNAVQNGMTPPTHWKYLPSAPMTNEVK